ncbi:MAG: class A beta-lactamase-related serine hydrolase [Candidatus Eremiobacteraeota bacterium]|nr:class A beta-lactamase-related serine hydrolase [Candidatus Eremiobacteraeota bacterium]
MQSTLIREAAHAARLLAPSIVIRRLDGTDNVDVRLDDRRGLYPASMIKTPLAAAALSLVERGTLRLDQRITVARSNMTTNDKPSPFVAGYEGTLSQYIELMITRSDNVATNQLFDVIGRERATQIVHGLGLNLTAFRRKLSGSDPLIVDLQATGRNTHPAVDAALLFEMIATDAIPFASRLREILGRQEWNEKLSPALRGGDHFAHKTGDTDEVSHDGGLLDTEEGPSYIVVVYTGLPSSADNDRRFGAFMRAVRPLL